MRSCLIAGCGDIGTRLAQRLAARGVATHTLRRSGAATINADLTDPTTLRALPAVDALVYLPAPARRDEAAYRALFVEGFANVLGAMPARPARVVFVSSTAVYGDHGGAWVDEDTPPVPPAFNGRVLLEAEANARALQHATVVVRFAGLYGPGRDALIRRVKSGAGGRDDAWTNRIHSDDAAHVLDHVLRLEAPVLPCYLGVDDVPALQRDVMRFIADRLGLPEPPLAVETEDAMLSGNKRLSNRRLRDSGFKFRYPDFRCGYDALLAER